MRSTGCQHCAGNYFNALLPFFMVAASTFKTQDTHTILERPLLPQTSCCRLHDQSHIRIQVSSRLLLQTLLLACRSLVAACRLSLLWSTFWRPAMHITSYHLILPWQATGWIMIASSKTEGTLTLRILLHLHRCKDTRWELTCRKWCKCSSFIFFLRNSMIYGIYGIRNELEANPKAGNLLSLSEFGPLEGNGFEKMYQLRALPRHFVSKDCSETAYFAFTSPFDRVSSGISRAFLSFFIHRRRVSRAYNHLISILNLFNWFGLLLCHEPRQA